MSLAFAHTPSVSSLEICVWKEGDPMMEDEREKKQRCAYFVVWDAYTDSLLTARSTSPLADCCFTSRVPTRSSLPCASTTFTS